MWQRVKGIIIPGHGVASGCKNDPRFPGGTIRMQLPHFRRRGLDLSSYYAGTLNISVRPASYVVRRPKLTVRDLKWHPSEPAEDFSFFDVRLLTEKRQFEGLIYYPHPDTKPEHFQDPSVLEILVPHIPGLSYGQEVVLQVKTEQLHIEIA